MLSLITNMLFYFTLTNIICRAESKVWCPVTAFKKIWLRKYLRLQDLLDKADEYDSRVAHGTVCTIC